MLRRTVKIQLLAFIAITLLGVSYVSAKYVGLFHGLLGEHGCTIHADFPDSGGIFTGAEVTYRGVTVGKVGQLHITDSGVRVDLALTNCDSPPIPSNARATVSDRSVIGEQYVNLLPANGNGPYLAAGDVIPQSRNSVPIAAETLLTNLDDLVNSVDLDALRTTVQELGQALNGQGPALGQLLDSTDALVASAQQNLPQTLDLIKKSGSVLNTQLAEGGVLKSFSSNLKLLAEQLKSSDGDIRRLLDDSPADLGVIRQFIQDNRTDLGVLLANMADVGDLLVRHRGGVEEVLELYPALPAGAETVISPDGVGALGLVLDINDPPDCGDPAKGAEGYGGTKRRLPSDTNPAVANTAAHCTASVSSGTNVRGSQNVPGGDPISTPDTAVAYSNIDSAGLLGDKSWEGILGASLH